MNKKTIAQVVSYFPPHIGGMERVVEEISKNLSQDGYFVKVFTSNIGLNKENKTMSLRNLEVNRLTAFEFAHTPIIPSLFFQLFKIKKPAIIHLHLAQVYCPEIVFFISKIRRIPYVLHYHLDVEKSGTLGFLFLLWKKWIQPLIIRSAEHVITLSPEQSNIIINRYGVSPSKVSFISNGVGNSFFELGKQEKTLGDRVNLLFVGRLSVQKRPERLIEALSMLKSTSVFLDVVGDGEDRAKLEQLVDRLNLKNIKFHGALHGSDLLEIYKKANVFVLPSDREGMPLVLLEAMAAGLPVMGSDVLGITELIQGVGVLVKDPSPETFAVAIDNLVNDKEKITQLTLLSKEKAKDYSWTALVQKLEGVYENIYKNIYELDQ